MPQSAKARRAYRKKYYKNNAEKLRSKQRLNYDRNVEDKQIKNRSYYLKNQQRVKAASHAYKLHYRWDPHANKKACHTYYARNKENICSYKRDQYALSDPKPVTKDAYMKDLHTHLLGNTKTKAHLLPLRNNSL